MTKKLFFAMICALPLLTFAQQKFSIIPGVGFGYRVSSLPDGLSSQEENYLKQLKTGVNFDIGAYYNINQKIGLGLKYNLFSASSSGTLSATDSNGMQQSFSASTKDQINFIGPSFIYSNFDEDVKHKLYYDLAIGYINYTSTTNNVEVTGGNLGLSSTISYMYFFTPMIAVGPQFNYTGGTLRKLKVNGSEMQLQDDNLEGLHRIALSIGAAIRF